MVTKYKTTFCTNMNKDVQKKKYDKIQVTMKKSQVGAKRFCCLCGKKISNSNSKRKREKKRETQRRTEN